MNEERLMIFVDGANVNKGSEQFNFFIDYEKLKDILMSKITGNIKLIRPYYYSATTGEKKYQLFHNRLEFIGYETRILNMKKGWGQKGVDIKLAVEMLSFGFNDKYDIAILVSGDKDFLPMVEMVKDLGKTVIVASFDHCCSGDLQRKADQYISLTKVKTKIKQIRK